MTNPGQEEQTQQTPAADLGQNQPQQPSQEAQNSGQSLSEKLLQQPAANHPAAKQESDPWEGDGWQGLVPDKFKKDGQIDIKSLAKSYLHAEKRLGSGDIPPKDESGYKLEYQFPEGVSIDAEREKSFLKGCHAKGMTNAQVQHVMDVYSSLIKEGMELQQGQQKSAVTDAETKLKQEWGNGFDTELANAQRAFHAVADDRDRASVNELSQSLPVMRLLAKLGANLREDTGLPPEISGMSAVDVESLQKSEAYWNPKHPDHSKVKQQITQYYQSKYSSKQR